MRKILFFAIFLYGVFSITDVVDETAEEAYLYNHIKIGEIFFKHNTPIERIQYLIMVLQNLAELNQNSLFEGPADDLGDAFKNENGKYKLDCNYEVLKRLLLCGNYFDVKEVVESTKVLLSECGIEWIVKSSSVLKEVIQTSYINELGQVLYELNKLNSCLLEYNTKIYLNYATQWENLGYIINDLSQLRQDLLDLRSQYKDAIKEEEKKKKQYRQIAAIQEKVKNIMDCINGNDDCSSKMRDIASIPSLLLQFKDIDESIVYETISQNRKDFCKLGFYFNDKEVRFDYQVIVDKIEAIIETYRKSITVENLQEWKDKLLKAYECIAPECPEMEKVFDKEIERREIENNELINHIAEKEKAMVNYLVNREIELKITRERSIRKAEKNKRKLETKEKKEKRTATYRDAELRNARKKAEKRYLKMISKESIMGTEKLFIPPIFADDDFVEEERLKLEEEKLEKIEKERIKIQKELNCKIKESGNDKRLVVAEDKIKRLNVTKNRTMKVRQQSTERKVPNRGSDVIESKKISNRKFVAQTTNIKTNSSSNVLNKGNVIKDSKNNLRYIGMRSTNVDGKIILPEEYIKLPLSVQKEYTTYEE